MNQLLQDISKYIKLEPEEKESILRLIETKTYSSKTFLFKEGEACPYLYFVNKGVLCSYISKNQNIGKIIRLATAGEWTSELKSFHYQAPSRYNLKTLEKTEVLQLSLQNYEELFRLVPKMERYFRLIMCDVLINTTNRMRDNLVLTTEERYSQFIKDFPGLAYRISEKYVASFIGVSPQFFSKIKSELLKK